MQNLATVITDIVKQDNDKDRLYNPNYASDVYKVLVAAAQDGLVIHVNQWSRSYGIGFVATGHPLVEKIAKLFNETVIPELEALAAQAVGNAASAQAIRDKLLSQPTQTQP